MIPTGGGIALAGLLLLVFGYDWGGYVLFPGLILCLFSWTAHYIEHHYPDEEEL